MQIAHWACIKELRSLAISILILFYLLAHFTQQQNFCVTKKVFLKKEKNSGA
jgi:hypothetical protein